jgi:cbb3-type cytochrome oxidase subunit 3
MYLVCTVSAIGIVLLAGVVWALGTNTRRHNK